MAELVYVLCAVTSLVCALLLGRTYFRTRSALLFWSALCFVALAANNSILVIDLLVVPQTDLSMLRTLTALAGIGTLVFGLIWEARG